MVDHDNTRNTCKEQNRELCLSWLRAARADEAIYGPAYVLDSPRVPQR